MKTNEKDTKQGVIPALRFPEFSKAGDWVYLEGNKVFEQISNRKHSSNLPILAISQEHGAVPRDLIDYKVIVSDEGIENYKVVEVGDFIISLRSFQGGIEYSAYNGICSPAYIILRKRLDVDNQFFKYYFKSRAFIRDLNKNLEGIRDGKMVSYKQFSEILLPIPSIHNKQEQQKIADCLSSIDALIKATENKIDVLKAHKKGLMQQLFPAEGKLVPALRFPEFQNAGEWSNSLLGKYIEKFQKKSFVQDEFEVLTSSREGLIRQREYYNNDRITERDNIGFNIVPPGYLTYRSRSDDRKFYFNENNLGITGIISTYYPVFHIINGYGKFFIELFSYYAEIIGKYSDGTSQTVLSLNRLKSIKLPIPTKSEQQKIADCLSSVDDLIMAQANRLEALRSHQKGLMQQLFPNIDEC